MAVAMVGLNRISPRHAVLLSKLSAEWATAWSFTSPMKPAVPFTLCSVRKTWASVFFSVGSFRA